MDWKATSLQVMRLIFDPSDTSEVVLDPVVSTTVCIRTCRINTQHRRFILHRLPSGSGLELLLLREKKLERESSMFTNSQL